MYVGLYVFLVCTNVYISVYTLLVCVNVCVYGLLVDAKVYCTMHECVWVYGERV